MRSQTKIIIAVVIVAALAYLSFALDIPYRKAPATVGQDSGAYSTSTAASSTSTADMVFLTSPNAGALISSPVKLRGYARGPWYFEATFPIDIVATDGAVIGSGHATAEGEWMTQEYVPWTATVSFVRGSSTAGVVRLKKDNPSGDPARDAHVDVSVRFATSTSSR